MDWGDISQLYADADDFICDQLPTRESQQCILERNYQYIEDGCDRQVTGELDLSGNPYPWKRLAKELDSSPRNGYCILFIPRAADVSFPPNSVRSAFTALPIVKKNWETVLQPLRLPRNCANVIERGVSSVVSIRRVSNESVQERVHMQIGTTAPEATGGFAFASTHFESRRFTSAVMFGCSESQIKDVKRLVSSFRHTNQHPLLMLGIFAELELRRIETLMSTRLRDYMYLRMNLQNAAEAFGAASRQRYYRPHYEKRISLFSWDTVKQFLTIRDQLQDAEEEIEVAKRHLDKVCRQFDELREDYKRDNNQGEEASKEKLEVTQMLSERFYDIVSRLDGFSSQCRLRVESISFWTDFTGSEFARQEANISARNAKVATLIAFVALVYLPITGVATILAMPIFGWANDWKNLLFQSIETIDESNGSSADSGSAGVTGTGLPVVSGYIWVYVSISAFFLIITLTPFAFVIYHRGGDQEPRGADY